MKTKILSCAVSCAVMLALFPVISLASTTNFENVSRNILKVTVCQSLAGTAYAAQQLRHRGFSEKHVIRRFERNRIAANAALHEEISSHKVWETVSAVYGSFKFNSSSNHVYNVLLKFCHKYHYDHTK